MRKVNFYPGGIYHIYNRGVERRDIFMDDEDRWRFLKTITLFNDSKSQTNVLWNLEQSEGANMKTLKNLLEEKDRDPLVKILADCFMDNHYHMLLKEVKEGGVSDFMHKVGTSYTMYFNKKYNRTGGLFQGRYRAALVEKDLYLKYLLVYINVMNPAQLKAVNLSEEGGVKRAMKTAADYYWSTHKEYLGERDSFLIEKDIFADIFETPEDYKSFARKALEEKVQSKIDHLTLE